VGRGARAKVISSLIGWPRLTPAVRKVMLLALPRYVARQRTQININRQPSRLAQFSEVGAKSWL